MIQASDVKDLREKTGAGMMDCKNALVQANGDMEEAIKILREKGLASAAKKAGRIAAEGIVDSLIDGKVGVVVEVNCETDFVAKTPAFKTFVQEVAAQIKSGSPASVEALLEQKSDKGVTVSDMLNEKVSEIGEKISIRRFARFEAEQGAAESYIHMGGKIGVLVEAACDESVVGNASFKAFLKDVAMQIAAANPLYVVSAEVPESVIAQEKEILRAQALAEGKPANIVDKMVDGRVQKYFKEVCLMEQPFVKDQDKAVKDILKEKIAEIGSQISIKRFVRYEMGEGLEKRKDDFVDEVMKQANL